MGSGILNVFVTNEQTKIVIYLKNSNCDETQISNCDETQKLKLWWNSKTQIVIKLKNSNYVKLKNSDEMFSRQLFY